MKKSYYLPALLTMLLLCLWGGGAFAQVPSTQGTEFFITYMKNGYRACNGSSVNEHLKAIISASDACQVTISNPNTAWSATVSVPQNSLVFVEIPYAQAYNEVSESVQNKGLLVVATDTISLVISNEATNSFDASFVLPTPVLADEYVMQNFVPTTFNNTTCPNANRSCFVVIATEDNTIVDITPTKNTQGGHLANNTFSVTLNTGQTYFVYSQQGGAEGDLSGSRVKARECDKIQVFNGNILTTIPITLSNGNDHIFEQAMPVAYWGKKFVVTSSLQRAGGDYVRVTALEDGTQIVKNGAMVATINAGATHEFILTANPGVAYLECSKPCAVNLYNTTSDYDASAVGDPSMVWISPIEQQIKDIVFGTFQASDGSININAVNLVCPTAATSSMQLDGGSIAGQFQPVPGNADYSYARIQIAQGTHHLSNATGFVGHVYGFGDVKGYAYSVGSSMINLNRMVFVNGLMVSDGATIELCQSDSILFTTSTSESDSVMWDMGDGSVFFQDSVVYIYDTEGSYEVMNTMRLHGYNCLGHLYDTLRYTVHVAPRERWDTVTICYGETCTRGDSVFGKSGDYRVEFHSPTGCLNIIYLHLTVSEAAWFDLGEDVTLCNGDITFLHSNYNKPNTFYYWNTGAGTPDIRVVGEGIYSLYVETWLADSTILCRHSDTIRVISSPYPVADFGAYPTEGCTPLMVQFEALAEWDNSVHDYGDVSLSYTWEVYNEAGILHFTSHEEHPRFEFTRHGTYSVQLIATSSAGCADTVVKRNFVGVIAHPEAEFMAVPEAQFLSDSGIYFLNFTDTTILADEASTWYWDFGDGTTDSATRSPVHRYEEWGDYVVSLFVSNSMGCHDRISHTVSIEAELKFPNVITPNGDGLNDVFAIENLNPRINPHDPAKFRTNRLTIFNRWGRKVYDAENYDTFTRNGDLTPGSKAFDGTNCPDGTYFYTFYYKGKLKSIHVNGTLMILRDIK